MILGVWIGHPKPAPVADPGYDYAIDRIRDWLEREGCQPHEIENVINDCLYDPWFRSINLDGARKASH